MKNNILLLFTTCIILHTYAMEEVPEIIIDPTQHVCAQVTIPQGDHPTPVAFCTICYEAQAENATIHLPCGHQFCKKCISHWHFERNARTTCPLCRAPISPITLAACAVFNDAGRASFAPPDQSRLSFTQRTLASDNYCAIVCCCCLNQEGRARPIVCMSEFYRQHLCTNTTPEQAYDDCSACVCATGCIAAIGTGIWGFIG